jgi:uncharacterized protein (DUF885 family)
MRLLALSLCLLFTLRVGASPNPGDVDARRKQLNGLIAEYWEYNLKQNPAFASIIGDKRYNDQLGSDSERNILADQAQKKAFLMRFEAIDTTGFATPDKLNRDLEVRDLKNDIEETDLKLWEMPVSQVHRVRGARENALRRAIRKVSGKLFRCGQDPSEDRGDCRDS